MCHTTPDGRHCTCPGVACCAVSDGFPFDAIFLRRKEEANKGGGGAGGGESRGGLGGLITHEELYVAQVEGGGDGVGTAGAVFPGSEEKEEIDPGEVCNSLVSWGANFGG